MKVIGLFVAIIFSFGAALGAMITMYAQVAARTREIGTLRAIGFRRRAVLVSFVAESVILSTLSGVVGCAVAGVLLGSSASFTTMNFQTFSEMTFKFHMTPGVVIAAHGLRDHHGLRRRPVAGDARGADADRASDARRLTRDYFAGGRPVASCIGLWLAKWARSWCAAARRASFVAS